MNTVLVMPECLAPVGYIGHASFDYSELSNVMDLRGMPRARPRCLATRGQGPRPDVPDRSALCESTKTIDLAPPSETV